MKRELLSVTSKMHHMSVHVERPWSKKMEITSYFYQNTANSYSGSNLVTIRMWWAMISYNSMKLYILFTFGFKLFIGRRRKNEKSWKFISVTMKKKWWYIIWNKNVPVSYSNLIQELWYFFSCRNESKQTLYQQTSNRIHKKVEDHFSSKTNG